MKFIDEYRDPETVKILLGKIESTLTHEWTIMEVCGGQTHNIVRFGIDQILPEGIHLVHGPGCPVCVTSVETIDKALHIASLPDVIFTSFGDMLRVPGTKKDLFSIKSEGGDIRIVYSPLDALKLAEEHPGKEVVFFSVGFETTAPATAMAVHQAKMKGIENFSLLTAHVLVPPAIEALLSSPENTVNGFLAAGHVCTVTGYEDYIPLADKYNTPIVVTGFEPVDLLKGIYTLISLLEKGTASVENQYSRVVKVKGNDHAKRLIHKVFTGTDRKWRGLGTIQHSGLKLSDEYKMFDAESRFDVSSIISEESVLCHSGEVLQGKLSPIECPEFGKSCTPEHPLGATMVSAEGACAAYFKYRK